MEYVRDARRLAAALALVLIVLFAPYAGGLRTLLSSASETISIYPYGAAGSVPIPPRALDPGAAGWFSEPALATAHRLESAPHGSPFWNPFVGYGTPFAATMQPQPFFPLSFLESLHPSPYTYTWYVLGRLFLAGLGAALFVRLFVGAVGAFAAGTSAMLGGYYLLFYNMPHLSVDVLLPGTLWAVELAVRRLTAARIATLGAVVGCVLLGGMPETAALSLVVVATYAAFRLWSTRGGDGLGRRALGLAAGGALGLALGAVQVFPFLELFRHSFDLHQMKNVGGDVTGVRADGSALHSILTELLPEGFGPPYHGITSHFAGYSGVRGFFGMTAFGLAVLALVAAARSVRPLALRAPTFFFAALGIFCVLKRYGSPLVNWVGTLPVLRLIGYPKYIEFVLGTCIAVLCGFGVDAVRRGAADRRTVAIGGAIAFACFTGLYVATRGEVSPQLEHANYYYGSLLVGLAFLAAVVALGYVASNADVTRRRVSCLLAAMLVAELAAVYIMPTFWNLDDAPSERLNPYAGGPYVRYLQQHATPSNLRVIALGGLLYPNWAGAFGLHDVRNLDAMYVEQYLRFVDAFLLEGTPPVAEDLFDRFTGTRALPLGTDRGRKWLTLSSVGYVASVAPLAGEPPAGEFLSALWTAAEGTIPTEFRPAVHLDTASIDGVVERVLFEHAPYDNIVFPVSVPFGRSTVLADLSLMPAVWQGAICGEGVRFRLEASVAGHVLAAAERYVDPKHRAVDRHWQPIRLDLARYAGKHVELRFRTALGVHQNACAAWSIWGEPRFTDAHDRGPLHPTARQHFRRVYGGDAEIYAYDDPLSRAHLFHDVVAEPDEGRALERLRDARTDVHRTAVIVGSADEVKVDPAAPNRHERAVLVTLTPNEIDVDVDAAAAALLMLNDTYYPGWKADVDGAPVPILRTDYLFRGVAIAPGRHHVRFRYASPVVETGEALSAIALIMIIALFALARLRRQHTSNDSEEST